jgi:hypothetical protein
MVTDSVSSNSCEPLRTQTHPGWRPLLTVFEGRHCDPAVDSSTIAPIWKARVSGVFKILSYIFTSPAVVMLQETDTKWREQLDKFARHKEWSVVHAPEHNLTTLSNTCNTKYKLGHTSVEDFQCNFWRL